jgi:hypothetical protein
MIKMKITRRDKNIKIMQRIKIIEITLIKKEEIIV